MNTQVITIKVDPATKKEAQHIASDLGLSLSAVLKGFLKQFIRTKTIKFTTAGDEPSEYLIKTIKQAEKDRKAGKASPIFKTGEEAVKWLEEQGI